MPNELRAGLPQGRFAELAAEASARCDALARCSEDAQRIHRTFCSSAMREAHARVSDWMTAAGMTTRVDAAANLIGRFAPPGCDTTRRLVIGSHLDTVIDAGRYDGILGVVLGLAAVAALRESSARLPWALEVYAFSDEEGVRYNVPFLGSRALAGSFDPALLRLCDSGGVSMAQALRDFGVDPLQMASCAVAGEIIAYLEAHIEQGPLLEVLGVPLGVVTAIAGQTRLKIEWTGQGGHAGTVPMAGRGDALTVACRWSLAVERLALETPGMVGTVGRLEVEPNVPNCIPRRVRASLDLRHHEDAVRTTVAEQLVELAERLGRDSRLAVRVEYDHQHAAVAMDAALGDRLAESISAAGYAPQRLVSGAGHDAGVMAGVAPAAMLFLRSPGGVSHHPDEAVTVDDVAAALRVMVEFVLRCAGA
ncbi:MAG TPA: allantoate amidohydrolase [Lacipirellulaceae bacterium]|nr:allantoate amidohydrolase [Lacipirellulaceae bacterium]